MRILICGATEVGYMIAAQLSLDHDITVIDESPHLPEKFRSLDIRHIAGNGSDIATLEKANQPKADLFIACSTIDEANIVACWTIKKITSIETVCFVSKGEIHHNLISPDQYSYQTKYDIDTVIWPEKLLTEDIFRIILVPEAIDVEYFINGRAKLFEYRIKKDSPFVTPEFSTMSFLKISLLSVSLVMRSCLSPKAPPRYNSMTRLFLWEPGEHLTCWPLIFFKSKTK